MTADTLQQSFDRLASSAHSIADHLVASRQLNRKLVGALLSICESESLDEAKLIAASELNGGSEI